jgi:Methylase involved in ubiquinone/menaquinone biosynthesis
VTPATPSLYDRIGRDYARRRRADPRIAAAIDAALGKARSVVNVGAGTGSYEPHERDVIAVEPSSVMLAQRPAGAHSAVQARAEALPFDDAVFDAALCVLTLHHWTDRSRGLRECIRVTRDRVVIVTFDPSAAGFWLSQRYLPELMELDRRQFPTMDELRAILGGEARVDVQPLPIPNDCADGFLGAFWARPHAYLDPRVQEGISSLRELTPAPVWRGYALISATARGKGSMDICFRCPRGTSATESSSPASDRSGSAENNSSREHDRRKQRMR